MSNVGDTNDFIGSLKSAVPSNISANVRIENDNNFSIAKLLGNPWEHFDSKVIKESISVRFTRS